MNAPQLNLRTPLDRRQFLRAGAVCLALPALVVYLKEVRPRT